MKLYFHYCTFGFSNAYVLGTEDNDKTKEAIIVDPGSMNETILKYIEDNEYTLKGVLITHDHLNHVHGLRTLKRIYDVDIYSVNPLIRDQQTILVRDGDKIEIGGFNIEVISVPGHSADSAVFSIEHLLFTGDALSAGLVGRTASTYAAANQITALRHKILSLPGDYTVLPGHGPPTTLEAERLFNAGINTYIDPNRKRVNFKIDI
ncbi:MBL fold metallo-hydrolase [Leadbettera azotonutricia]|uniref:Metallo-beta-lactamase family protein n=1 Tax=Leadbettera azotonutricia (strain ATCC BAA-888 / DSM 13862 / ZAS-9) TaxID=545695 RepID=F5Y878_LEAAZ|nr:MBL fold metallo-hydrolase [Leadbettera azotonutricia]AEF81404.1 metallo-beta-lactamase family protein [Leadbettera azotonutricia ZAS-9]